MLLSQQCRLLVSKTRQGDAAVCWHLQPCQSIIRCDSSRVQVSTGAQWRSLSRKGAAQLLRKQRMTCSATRTHAYMWQSYHQSTTSTWCAPCAHHASICMQKQRAKVCVKALKSLQAPLDMGCSEPAQATSLCYSMHGADLCWKVRSRLPYIDQSAGQRQRVMHMFCSSAF